MIFAAEAGEFVVTIVTRRFAESMVKSSADAPRGVSEFAFAGLAPQSSTLVACPRVQGIAAAMECNLTQVLEPKVLSGAVSGIQPVVGQVIGIHIDDTMLSDGRFDYTKAGLISRLGYRDYAAIGGIFEMRRPKWQDLIRASPACCGLQA